MWSSAESGDKGPEGGTYQFKPTCVDVYLQKLADVAPRHPL